MRWLLRLLLPPAERAVGLAGRARPVGWRWCTPFAWWRRISAALSSVRRSPRLASPAAFLPSSLPLPSLAQVKKLCLSERQARVSAAAAAARAGEGRVPPSLATSSSGRTPEMRMGSTILESYEFKLQGTAVRGAGGGGGGRRAGAAGGALDSARQTRVPAAPLPCAADRPEGGAGKHGADAHCVAHAARVSGRSPGANQLPGRGRRRMPEVAARPPAARCPLLSRALHRSPHPLLAPPLLHLKSPAQPHSQSEPPPGVRFTKVSCPAAAGSVCGV